MHSTMGDTEGTWLGNLLWKIIRSELDRRYGKGRGAAWAFAERMTRDQPLRALHMVQKELTPDKAALLVKLLNSPLGRRLHRHRGILRKINIENN
jgi:hypothetical protein